MSATTPERPTRAPCCGSGGSGGRHGAAGPAAAPDGEALARALFAAPDAPPEASLLELLDERHAIYAGLGAPAVARVRGALLLGLGRRPLSPAGLDFVLEELESAHDAYLAAVAAHVLRRAAAPDEELAAPLVAAALSLAHADDRVRLDVYGGYGPDGTATSALEEILASLRWLGGRAAAGVGPLTTLDRASLGQRLAGELEATLALVKAGATATPACCACASSAPPVPPAPWRSPDAEVRALGLEDQAGGRLTFDAFFVGKPSIVVFFYTRCANPNKCPLTISRLGDLQRDLFARGLGAAIRTAAVTYDPEYDLPERLEQYRRAWGAEAGPDHRLLRTLGPLGPLAAWFELGVGHAGSIVNRHRLETFVLDADGRIAHAVVRRRWDPADLVERARRLLPAPSDARR